MPSNDLLTSGEVAAAHGVNRTTVHHWAKDGKLPVAQTVNGIRLFLRSDSDKLAADRAAAAAETAS